MKGFKPSTQPQPQIDKQGRPLFTNELVQQGKSIDIENKKMQRQIRKTPKNPAGVYRNLPRRSGNLLVDIGMGLLPPGMFTPWGEAPLEPTGFQGMGPERFGIGENEDPTSILNIAKIYKGILLGNKFEEGIGGPTPDKNVNLVSQ